MGPWLEPFHYEYMLKAMAVSALICGVCGFLSCFVILKGWSLMGDALSHAIVPGVAIASILGAPYALGAFLSGLIAAFSMGWIRSKTGLREDSIIGVVFTAFFALGVFLISIYPSGVALKTIVLGNILGIADGDILQVAIVSIITLTVLSIKWRDLLLVCFEPQHAQALGLPVRRLQYLLLTLLAATAVASMQTVGACLVVATLVTPGATAYMITNRFSNMIKLAVISGILSGLIGAYLSYFLDGSTGGCIVVLQTLIFMAAFVYSFRKTKHADGLNGAWA